ncbi:MAG: hypothetical protein H7Z42_20600 [Roseiflexaceae bacterium]|nr:hypothetical protein [Roseiflexaceae bacterium]
MKTQVFVLVPYSLGPSALVELADALIMRHQMLDEDRSVGRFDYLVGSSGCFDDPIAEGRLPARVRRSLHHRVCEMERLPIEFVPGALITPDGLWHDLDNDGRLVNGDGQANPNALTRWEARYRELITQHPYCWVLEYRAHS